MAVLRRQLDDAGAVAIGHQPAEDVAADGVDFGDVVDVGVEEDAGVRRGFCRFENQAGREHGRAFAVQTRVNDAVFVFEAAQGGRVVRRGSLPADRPWLVPCSRQRRRSCRSSR